MSVVTIPAMMKLIGKINQTMYVSSIRVTHGITDLGAKYSGR
jgi:hypothetical protein